MGPRAFLDTPISKSPLTGFALEFHFRVGFGTQNRLIFGPFLGFFFGFCLDKFWIAFGVIFGAILHKNQCQQLNTFLKTSRRLPGAILSLLGCLGALFEGLVFQTQDASDPGWFRPPGFLTRHSQTWDAQVSEVSWNIIAFARQL